jgi:hypothetical protein
MIYIVFKIAKKTGEWVTQHMGPMLAALLEALLVTHVCPVLLGYAHLSSIMGEEILSNTPSGKSSTMQIIG